MIQRTIRSPYLTDSRVQTFYFLQRMGATGEIFSLEDISNVLDGYHLSSIQYYLPRWKILMLTPYSPQNGRTFFESKRPDRQFYTCRSLSLWNDWVPFMQSCFWDRRPILPPRPDPELPIPEPEPLPLPSLSDDFFRLMGFVFCIVVLLFGGTVLHIMRRQWTVLSWSRSHITRLLFLHLSSRVPIQIWQ